MAKKKIKAQSLRISQLSDGVYAAFAGNPDGIMTELSAVAAIASDMCTNSADMPRLGILARMVADLAVIQASTLAVIASTNTAAMAEEQSDAQAADEDPGT